MAEQSGRKQEQHTLTYLSQFGSNLLDSMIKKFSNPETARRNRFILLVSTALLLTLAILPTQHTSQLSYNVGDIATSDIRANQNLLVEDKALTEQRRKDAANNAPVVYNLNDQVPGVLNDKLQQTLAIVLSGRDAKPKKSISQWRTQLTPLLDTDLSDDEILALTRIKSEKIFLACVAELLNELYQRKIVLDGKVFQTDTRRGLELTDNNGHTVGAGDSSASYTEIAEARRIVTMWSFKGVGSTADNAHISSIIARILLPNLFYNREASESRSRNAMETVRRCFLNCRKGRWLYGSVKELPPNRPTSCRRFMAIRTVATVSSRRSELFH